MYHYKLCVAYDGTDFFGWQEQPSLPTIAHTLKKSFARIFGAEGTIIAASRTDAGVHAHGQIALFSTNFFFDPEKMRSAWNNGLLLSIDIRELEIALPNFHPWYNIAYKIYQYHFFLERPSPLFARYGWHYAHFVNLEKLQTTLACFVGTHDFRSFITDPGDKETILTIDAITLTYNATMNAYCIEVRGKKFFQHMVRRIVGAALHASSREHISLEYVIQIRNACNPHHRLVNAPAQGLLLYKVVFL
jgi:tRNA pseudouridine38-40 synthase